MKISALWLIAIFSFFTLSSQAQDTIDLQSYLNYELGNSWMQQFHNDSGFEETQRQALDSTYEVDGTSVLQMSFYNESFYNLSLPETIDLWQVTDTHFLYYGFRDLYVDPTETDGDEDLGDYLFNEPINLPRSVSIGFSENFERTVQSPQGDVLPIELNYEVAGFEDITTEFGNYTNALKIVTTFTEGEETETRETWYAEGVGEVRSVAVDLEGEDTTELISYETEAPQNVDLVNYLNLFEGNSWLFEASDQSEPFKISILNPVSIEGQRTLQRGYSVIGNDLEQIEDADLYRVDEQNIYFVGINVFIFVEPNVPVGISTMETPAAISRNVSIGDSNETRSILQMADGTTELITVSYKVYDFETITTLDGNEVNALKFELSFEILGGTFSQFEWLVPGQGPGKILFVENHMDVDLYHVSESRIERSHVSFYDAF